MKTNEVEKQTGLSKQTILYYEKEGLLCPTREANGYRDYTQQDVQLLLMIKFLRNLNVSIDDIQLVLQGKLTLREVMQIQEEFLTEHLDDLGELQRKVKILKGKEVPLLPQMEEIADLDKHTLIRVKRANDHVAIGRRATKELVKGRTRLFLLEMLALIIVGYLSCYIVLHQFVAWWIYVPIATIVVLLECIIFLKFGSEGNNPYVNMTFFFNINDPFIEFVEDHIIYQKERTLLQNALYLWDVLHGKGERWYHTLTYEEIDTVKIVARQRWMNATGGHLAIPWFVPCFTFTFANGDHLYLEAMAMLDDDARWVANILKSKVSRIEDPNHVLDIWCSGENLNEALAGSVKDRHSYF